MPTFDVVSEVDRQELHNAVDQAQREVSTRFDFKDTGSTIELTDKDIQLHSSTEDRMRALRQVLEEKLVKRQVSLKALEWGKVEEAAKSTVRQTATINAGIVGPRHRIGQVTGFSLGDAHRGAGGADRRRPSERAIR